MYLNTETVNDHFWYFLDQGERFSDGTSLRYTYISLFILCFLAKFDSGLKLPKSFDLGKTLGEEKVGLSERISDLIGEIDAENGLGWAQVVDFRGHKSIETSRWDMLVWDTLMYLYSRLPADRVSGQTATYYSLLYRQLLLSFRRSDRTHASEDRTSEGIDRLLVALVDPEPGMSIYDPACGTAEFLVEAQHYVEEKYPPLPKVSVVGVEANAGVALLAKFNLLLHQQGPQSITCGNALVQAETGTSAADEIQLYDRIVTNPPFSLKEWGARKASDRDLLLEFGAPPDGNADYAFILHVLRRLNDNGKAAVIVPPGALYRSGQEGKIREGLVSNGYVKAVITLPANIFSWTAISTCIVIFTKNDPVNATLFIDTSSLFSSAGKRPKLSDDIISSIVDFYQKHSVVPNVTALVPLEDIAKQNYSLDVSRYVIGPHKETKPLKALLKVQGELEAELHRLQTQMREITEAIVADRKD